MKMTTTTTMEFFCTISDNEESEARSFFILINERGVPLLYSCVCICMGWRYIRHWNYTWWLMRNGMGVMADSSNFHRECLHKRLIFTYSDTFSHLHRGRKQWVQAIEEELSVITAKLYTCFSFQYLQQKVYSLLCNFFFK